MHNTEVDLTNSEKLATYLNNAAELGPAYVVALKEQARRQSVDIPTQLAAVVRETVPNVIPRG